jgi:prophage maintenance system killer protein
MLSKKDILTANKLFHTGRIVNEGSLDYAISTIARSRNWLRTAAVLTRAILIDHVFEDGNKRTAAAVILSCCDMSGVYCNPQKVNAAIVQILLKNVSDMRKIERLIKNAIE